MTNVQGDVGFPDLFMVHPFQGGRPLVIELKAEKGKLTPGQKVWLNACEYGRMFMSKSGAFTAQPRVQAEITNPLATLSDNGSSGIDYDTFDIANS